MARLRVRDSEVGGDAFGHWGQRWTDIAAEGKGHISAGAYPGGSGGSGDRASLDILDEGRNRWRSGDPVGHVREDGQQGAGSDHWDVVSTEAWDYIKGAFAVRFNARS